MKPPAPMVVGGSRVRAVSVGGVQTCIELPSWKLAFDIGKCPDSSVSMRRIFFTHTHVDHVGSVVHHTGTRALRGMSPPIYYVPEEYLEDFEALMAVWRRLDRSDLPCEVHPVRPGDTVQLDKDRSVRVFRATHRIPTVGYALMRRRTHLRPELRGLSQYEISQRKRAGEEVAVSTEAPEVVFCGDTTIRVVVREPLVRQARLLILEVTFLDDRVPRERARKTGHIHLDDVLEHAELFENEAILFTHFSARYSPSQITSILQARLPPSLRDRVVPLLPR